ncbi:MAG: FxSxx-COOH system tetratricopeptide repeat protein [Pseudonocardia sp.]
MVGAPDSDGVAGPDFFVSYTHLDQRWAEWIGWVLEDAGFRVVIRARDFGAGSHVVADMHRGMRGPSPTVVVVLSAAYLSSGFVVEERQGAWAADPAGQDRRLLVFRVEDCPREGLPRPLVMVDLFGVDRETAHGRLLAAVGDGRLKPDAEPLFTPVRTEMSETGGEPLFPRPPVVWGVPWPRNPNFTGRAGELAVLRSRLADGSLAGGSARAAVFPQVLHGLGGVGKTQLAVEYAYRYATDYDLVWWVPAEQPAPVVAALAELATQIDTAIPGEAQDSAAAAVQLLRNRERFPRWLVIADNAGASSDLSGLLAAAGSGGHVLVTSRDPSWAQVAQTVEVDVLSRAEAVALLHARAPRLTDAQAHHIAELLGGLPLALEQAGAWLANSGMSAADYANRVEHRAREILTEGAPAGYPVAVGATWTVAVDTLDDPAAVMLLRLWAFFGPDPIPTDLIGSDTTPIVPAVLATLAADPLTLSRVIARLTAFGLVRLAEQGVVMHRLVQTVLRDHMPTSDRDGMYRTVHALLAAAAPADPHDPTGWTRYAQLYPHALATNVVDGETDDARLLIQQLCNYLRSAGDYPNSLALARHAYRRWQRNLGEDHPDTITAAGNLGNTLRALGDYPGARATQEDVLARSRRILGADHPDTVTAAAHLATTLWALGDLPGARSIDEDVLARRRRILGADHPDTVTAAANLAATLWALGDYPGARATEEDVLARSRRILGADHPDTVTAAANLATTLRALGDYPGARTIDEDVLARRRRILGADHPDTVTAAAHLAATLWVLGDYPDARATEEDVLARRRRILGEDHPDTITAAATVSQWTDEHD